MELVKVGRIKLDEVGASVMDFETGASLGRGPDTVAWNEYRQRWIAFFADRPGGVIFAEADTPTGPWGYGRRIATHDEYNFYNIAYHPFFDQEAGSSSISRDLHRLFLWREGEDAALRLQSNHVSACA